METLSQFTSLTELIRALEKERKLIQALFQDRKKLSFHYNLARELANKKDESLAFLRQYGIIRENADILELEDVYLKFFEEVLQVNEEISVASVKESIDNLNAAIDYYLLENNSNRKYSYLRDVKRILKQIALSTMRNVIDLKRNIDNTYKNQPNYAIKKKKLERLDEKRRDIALLVNECEKLIDEKQTTFFLIAMDVQLKEIVTDVRYQFTDVYHNLLQLDKQIIHYLNLIEEENRLFQKVQKLKYLRDQLLLETNTNIEEKAALLNPAWMEPRPRYPLKVSLSTLRNTDLGLQIIQSIAAGKNKNKQKRGNLAEPLTADEMSVQQHEYSMVDIGEVKNAFMASGDHLFHFVMNYSGYPNGMNQEAKLVLYCQIAAQYYNEMIFKDEYGISGEYEYQLIYPKIA